MEWRGLRCRLSGRPRRQQAV